MRVFIANFGRENYEWPTCLERGTVATMNALPHQRLWELGDRDGYIDECLTNGRTAAGLKPTKAVASRWFNLMTIVAKTESDLWLHRDGERVWWTVSGSEPPTYEPKTEPIARGEEVIVCHKLCDPWSDQSRNGRQLLWKSLHPKARDFLSTEATLQQLGPDNAAYVQALINGGDRTQWHQRFEWRRKDEQASSKYGEVRIGDARRKAATREAYELYDEAQAAKRMTRTAMRTAAQSNGQIEGRRVKNKEVRFDSASALSDYIVGLIERQEGRCELTGLSFTYDEPHGDSAFFASLDRIDSDGHYEKGNLQVVCRFANRWKGAEADKEFRRLIAAVRGAEGLEEILQ